MSKKILGEKHVVVAVVEVNNSNPNGDKVLRVPTV